MYLDFTSLYPSVQKKNIFPVGHPQIYIGNDECRKIDLKNVMGLVKCTVLPPRNLLFPVLPVRIEGKLIFPLCFACAKEKQQACNHVETERYLCGTWTSVEINKAVEKKYQIVEIFEIFEIYDYKQRKQIFGEYVNTFLKIKQESSGVPQDCLDEDGRVNEQRLDNFVKDFQRVEGVLLEKEKIQKNPALRTIAKKLLNSLWGKLAQNDNSVVVDFLNDYEELAEMLNDNTLELTSIDFISDNIARCTHKKKLSTSIYLENRNVVVASFVTAYARLELYKNC